MAQTSGDRPHRVGFFDSVAQADRAVRNLLAAGFTKDQLAVICPEQCQPQFAPGVRRAEQPGSHAGKEIAEGGAVGAAIGGITLAAAAVATGGVGLLPAIPVLLGGGAIAGGFSSYILADGYGKGISEYWQEAVHLGKIVVGVELDGDDNDPRLTTASASSARPAPSLPSTKFANPIAASTRPSAAAGWHALKGRALVAVTPCQGVPPNRASGPAIS